MRSISVSSCRCCMFVPCMHAVAVLNDSFLHDLQFVNADQGCKGRPSNLVEAKKGPYLRNYPSTL